MSGPGVRPERSFEEAARLSLRDSQLRRNLGHATRVIRAKRAEVVDELPDWEELREAGRALKDRTLGDLEGGLVQFEQALSAAGGRVHWARDADEAGRTVVELVRSHGVREVVKVKSITTDEIGLNRELERAGIEPVETDLAELIVQLGEDFPSHILVPAIHRNRAEIRELFRRRLDLPELGDDPSELAEAARLHLRRKFLEARVAVSGANFAVAETGTVCVVESEGNGRMCTTLPEVLVTVMGIEKLVSSWADLEVFLQLLPRSSTGERMNPYTSFWTGVREGDGPREFHLVLLDAGRTDVLGDPVGRQALRCIRCSACLNVCPVYSRTGGHAYGSVYPGPIGAILTPQLGGRGRSAEADSLPFASSLCGACYEVCPVKIDIPEVLVHLRAEAVERGAARGGLRARLRPERLALRALARAFADRRSYERAQLLARVAQRPLAHAGRIERAPGPLAAWTAMRDLPPVAEQTFREWWRSRAAERGGGEERLRPPRGAPPGRRAPRRIRPEPASFAPGATTAREEVLRRVRAAHGGAGAGPEVPRAYRRAEASTREELVERFAERVAEYRAGVWRAGAGGLAESLSERCAERGARRLAVPLDLRPEWRPGGVELVADEGLAPPELEALDGALTTCALAIAETGTIVLDSGPGQGRRALTLVPDYHLCVVPEERIVGLVPEAVERLEPAVREGRPVTFVSGPSATSDIELSRVEGVHGPRTLDVVIAGRL